MQIDRPGLFSCFWTAQSFIGDKVRRKIPEQIVQGLVLEQGDEDLLVFQSYEQRGDEWFYDITDLADVCMFLSLPVAPFWAVK